MGTTETTKGTTMTTTNMTTASPADDVDNQLVAPIINWLLREAQRDLMCSVSAPTATADDVEIALSDRLWRSANVRARALGILFARHPHRTCDGDGGYGSSLDVIAELRYAIEDLIGGLVESGRLDLAVGTEVQS